MIARSNPVGVRMIRSARIVVDHGHQFWHCPNCDKRLGELIGDRVRIQIRERVISLRLDADPDQVCPTCGETSMVTRGEQAA